jgi:membrane protease subunit HflK
MSESNDKKRSDDELNQGAQEVVRILRWFFGGLTVIMIAAMAYFLVSGIFILESGKQAAIYRFGRLVDPIKEKQDWYWSWPKHIDERKEVKVSRPTTITCTYFWYKEDPRSAAEGPSSDPSMKESLVVGDDGYHLTADNNVMHSKWSLDYVVSDLKAYLTRCTNVEFLVRTVFRNAVVRASGKMKVDDIFKDDKGEFVRLVKSRVISQVAAMKIGIKVVKVNLDAKAVPQPVKPAFDEKTNAANETDKFKKDAEGYANSQLKEGEAEASRLLEEAQTYKSTILNSVVADAEYMEQLLPEYLKHGPSILLREYSDVLLKVLQGATQIAVVSPDQEVRIRIEPRLKPQVKREKDPNDQHGGH